MDENTFSLVRTNNGWTGNVDRFSMSVCTCGIASGSSYATPAEALAEHHTCLVKVNGRYVYRGRPVWNGKTIEVLTDF